MKPLLIPSPASRERVARSAGRGLFTSAPCLNHPRRPLPNPSPAMRQRGYSVSTDLVSP